MALQGGLRVTGSEKPETPTDIKVTMTMRLRGKRRMAMYQPLGEDAERGVSVGTTMDGYVYILGPTGYAEIGADALAEALSQWCDADGD